VIEVSMALVVLMLLDAFFIGHARSGLSDSPFGLTDRLAHDWPILAAHVILFACLLPMSAIDLEHYWVDVRFTNLAVIAGFVFHTLWTPKHSREWIRPWDTTGAVCLFALVALAVVWLVLVCQPRGDPEESEEGSIAAAEPLAPLSPVHPIRRLPPSLASPLRLGGWVGGVMLVATLVFLVFDEADVTELRHSGRALLPLGFFFMLIIWEGTLDRPADHQIMQAINDEREGARQMVMIESALLLPAVLAALVGAWVMRDGGELSGRISQALHTELRLPGLTMMRNWSPLYGLATAATGYIIAGAIGWTVRIVFTIAFGKEAFGAGDIHLMAAAGCIAGWPVVVLGFTLTCGLALIGWVAALPFKRTRAVPLGPWLSLSFLAVVVFYDSIIRWPPVARAIDTAHLLFLSNR
jgi:prepilin signal peptidase PulO-like enzyme (type II secretory pathway)